MSDSCGKFTSILTHLFSSIDFFIKGDGPPPVMSGIAAVTAFREGNMDDIVERTRATVFLDTARACRAVGLPLFGVYKECTSSYLAQIAAGTTLFPQSSVMSGMGSVRREAIRAALSHSDADLFLWLEPEKPHLPSCIDKIVLRPETEFCFLNRADMQSYPAEQADYYLFCRHVASALLGVDVDYAFGPMIFSRSCARLFLEYDGRYGDRWDAILIPRIRVVRTQIPYEVHTIPFENDPRMKAIEEGNPRIIMKRLEQFNNVIPSLIEECARTKPL